VSTPRIAARSAGTPPPVTAIPRSGIGRTVAAPAGEFRRGLPDSSGVGSPHEADILALADHLRRVDVLDPAELRELIPSLLILESVAVRDAPPFDAEAIAALRAANQRLADSPDDATAAALADDEFHRRLTAGCGNPRLLEVADLVRRALLGYEREYLVSPERLAQSVREHEAVIAALESGDHGRAAERLRENYTSGMPAPEPRRPPPG
jgi:DNA-binding GntR family transcriptional regulator